MAWAAFSMLAILSGVAFLLITVRDISRTFDDDRHYRLCIRFWAGLAVLGVWLVGIMAIPLAGQAWLASQAGSVTIALIAILPGVVIFVGSRNACLIARAARRRHQLGDNAAYIEGHVLSRAHPPLSADVMEVVVEADLPCPTPDPELRYRAHDPDGVRRHRFVEVCPADHWQLLAPGQRVTVRYDPVDPSRFAVLLLRDRRAGGSPPPH